jgi:DNA-binding MarR family transcriptional regulator
LIKYDFDKIIHERARLFILIYLANSNNQQIPFNELKENLELTSGNLSVQLTNLEEAGYIQVQKSFQNKKPMTNISLTPDGLTALKKYMLEMEGLIHMFKHSERNQNRK